MSTASATITQANRPIGVTTDLGDDKLLLEQFSMSEGLSRPFRMSLTLLAQPDYTVPFEKLLGQKATVRLDVPESAMRYFSGIVYRLSEAPKVHSPDTGSFFIRYTAEVMPSVWLLNRVARSRIFQHKSVPDILKAVLTGFDVSWNIKGTFDPRDYCAQYRETDFQFASRLMEEEGIFYFFKHTDSGHTMVVANSPDAHADLTGGNELVFNEFQGLRDKRLHEDRIIRWQKSQELRSGKYTAWDFCFEEPDKNLEASEPIQDSLSVGTITHKLKVGGNDQWEIYEFPGGYAGRYDGIDKGGAPQPSDLSKIEQDNTRTVKIRMQQEALPGLVVDGDSNVRRLEPGYKIKVKEHFNANGDYVLTDVEHVASMAGTYTTQPNAHLQYQNRFRCIPAALPYRPARTTPKPRILGTQTAIVVGSDSSAEIATDKYGRVKVQFFWDREGKKIWIAPAGCAWAQMWAGKRWGTFFLPRVKDEVVVAFLEGDPDQPIIVGSVYNADQMPPYDLPDNKTRSTIKTRSSEKGTTDNFNELRFEDKKDSEEVYFHAEKDFNRVVENNDTLKVGFDKKDKGDQTIDIYNNRTTTLDQGNESLTVKKGTRTVTVQSDDKHEVKQGNLAVQVDQGNAKYDIQAGSCTIQAATQLTLKVGDATIVLKADGSVTINGVQIKVQATAMLQSQGAVIKIAADGMLQAQGGIVQIN